MAGGLAFGVGLQCDEFKAGDYYYQPVVVLLSAMSRCLTLTTSHVMLRFVLRLFVDTGPTIYCANTSDRPITGHIVYLTYSQSERGNYLPAIFEERHGLYYLRLYDNMKTPKIDSLYMYLPHLQLLTFGSVATLKKAAKMTILYL
jgi:hypothetical protein